MVIGMESDARRYVRAMDWNLIHTFIALAESSSVTAAASLVGRSQPTVSSALARLEKQLGQKLIERSPGRFELTEAGRLLYAEAIEIQGIIGRFGILMREVPDRVSGHVKIALASHVICPLFDSFLSDFHRRFPRATFSLDVMSSEDALAEVAGRRASLAICLTDRSDQRLDYEHLYREFFGLFCGPHHPLYGSRELELSALQGHSSVRFATDRLDDVLRSVALVRAEAGLDQRITATSSHLEEVRRAIIAGLGIGALPIHVARPDLNAGLLWRLPPYHNPPAIDVHMATRPEARLNRAETLFVDQLRKLIRETPLSLRTYT